MTQISSGNSENNMKQHEIKRFTTNYLEKSS